MEFLSCSGIHAMALICSRKCAALRSVQIDEKSAVGAVFAFTIVRNLLHCCRTEEEASAGRRPEKVQGRDRRGGPAVSGRRSGRGRPAGVGTGGRRRWEGCRRRWRAAEREGRDVGEDDGGGRRSGGNACGGAGRRRGRCRLREREWQRTGGGEPDGGGDRGSSGGVPAASVAKGMAGRAGSGDGDGHGRRKMAEMGAWGAGGRVDWDSSTGTGGSCVDGGVAGVGFRPWEDSPVMEGEMDFGGWEGGCDGGGFRREDGRFG